MNIHFQPLVIHHIIQSDRRVHQPLRQVLLVEVVDWEVHRCYATILVVLAHQRPVRSSMVDIDLGLHVEHSCDAGLHHSLGVLFDLGIGADEDVGVADLLEGETTDEVGVSHLDVTVHDVCLLHIAPNIRAGLSEFATVVFGVLQAQHSAWLPLPHICVHLFIPY